MDRYTIERHIEKGRSGFLLMHGIRHVATVYGTPQEAQVMAAAPALLEALEAMVNIYTTLTMGQGYTTEIVESDPFVIKARAAIAQAKGETV